MKIKEALKYGEEKLASLDLPFLESSLLLCHILDTEKEKLFSMMTDEISGSSFSEFAELVRKRLSGVPYAYITGSREFFSRDFYVNENVLIPRPDTEVLIEAALEIASENRIETILDLCTGSGCIAVTLALELPESSVYASDVSAGALDVYKENCRRYAVRPACFLSDLFENINGKFNMIASNPPYLTDNEVREKETEGLFEPALALAAGADGLGIIRKIIKISVDYLESDGYLLLEASPDQCDAVKYMMLESGFGDTMIINDLAGRNRVTIGKFYGNKA